MLARDTVTTNPTYIPSITVVDEIRELHSSNKTKNGYKNTARTRNKKATTVTLCLGGDYSLTYPSGQQLGDSLNYVYNVNAEVFDCDDITVGRAVPLSVLRGTDLPLFNRPRPD